MYATPWRMADGAAGGELPDYLELWRFERYYRLSADQLPACYAARRWMSARWGSGAGSMGGQVTGARIWLFRLPSGQIVAALSLEPVRAARHDRPARGLLLRAT